MCSQRVSVALATYQGESFLRKQLDSLASQTRLPDELVVFDDQSDDNTQAIVADFSATAGFEVSLFIQPSRRGYSRNFADTLAKCSGDLVFLCDQDDYWFPQKIERVLASAAHRPEQMVFQNDALLADEMLQEVGVTKFDQFRSAKIPLSKFVMGCCTAVRREFLALALPIPATAMSHDDWLIDLATVLDVRYFLESPLQLYRRHEANASTAIFNSTKRITSFEKYVSSLKAIIFARNGSLARKLEHKQAVLHRLQESEELIADTINEQAKSRFDELAADVARMEKSLASHSRSVFGRVRNSPAISWRGLSTGQRLAILLRDILGRG
ncbi:MAG: glycosyltransferase [Pseudomonadota bacterium]